MRYTLAEAQDGIAVRLDIPVLSHGVLFLNTDHMTPWTPPKSLSFSKTSSGCACGTTRVNLRRKDAATIKGTHAVALPDAFCLALLRRLGGTAVTTDHTEFDPLVIVFIR